MVAMPSSGSITSPVPESRNVCFGIGHDQECFELTEHLVSAPVFGELHGSAAKITCVLLQLDFEAGEE